MVRVTLLIYEFTSVLACDVTVLICELTSDDVKVLSIVNKHIDSFYKCDVASLRL